MIRGRPQLRLGTVDDKGLGTTMELRTTAGNSEEFYNEQGIVENL